MEHLADFIRGFTALWERVALMSRVPVGVVHDRVSSEEGGNRYGV